MNVGSLGGIVFKVSNKYIKTFDTLIWQGSAKIQEHERHLKKDLPEYVGYGLDTLKLEFTVSKYLSESPKNDINLIKKYVREGRTLKLIIGKKLYGYRWLIADYNITGRRFDNNAKLIEARIALTLKEYQKV